MDKSGYVYIMMNKGNTVIYTGVTSDLRRRAVEHKKKELPGFTRQYNLTKLVYYEVYQDIRTAIRREKQIKGGSRKKKWELIVKKNPEFKDLYNDLLGG